MPASKMVVVYSIAQSRARRIIVPDDDSQINVHTNNLAVGEAATVMDWIGQLPDIDGINAAISNITGRPVLDDTYHVVDDTGNIIAAYKLDPSIDDMQVLDIPANAELVSATELDTKVNAKQAVKFADKVGVPVAENGAVGIIANVVVTP